MASMNALAAAAASGPSIEKGITLDSLDGRIVQYYYGCFKLTKLMAMTRDLLVRIEKDKTLIPLTNSILLLSGPIFNINDLIYKRFEILNNGGVFNPKQPIQSQLNTNSVNFDLNENLTNYDTTRPQKMPDAKKNVNTLKLFEELSKNALQIYEEKLNQAIHERAASRLPGPNGKPIEFDSAKLRDLSIFTELSVLPSFTYSNKNADVKNEDEVKAALQDIDLSSIKTMTAAIDRVLSELEPLIKAVEKCKTKKDILLLNHWDYAVHRCLFLLLRLADIYAIIRKFGKRIFFQDYHYLKALSQYYKSINDRLASLEACFNQQRKSNLLLASVAKLTRQGARMQVRPDALLTLAKDARNGYQVVSEANKSLKDLYVVWVASANDFSKKHGTSTSMSSLREKAKNDVLKQRIQQSKKIEEDRKLYTQRLERLYVDPSKNKADVESQAKFLKQVEDEAKEKRAEEMERQSSETSSQSNRSRSSSASNGSTSSSLTLHQNLSRSPSLQRKLPSAHDSPRRSESNTPSRRNSLILTSPVSKNSSALSRRNSVASRPTETTTSNFYNTPTKVNSSTSSLRSSVTSSSSVESSPSVSSSPPALASLTSPNSTKRLSSTPLRRSSSLQHSPGTIRNTAAANAAAGAGAAFTNRKTMNQSQTKANSLQNTSQAFQRKIQAKQQEADNKVKHMQAPIPSTPPKALSAQQRLQAHILSQSRNGNMNVKSMADKPKVIQKSTTPNLTSPTSSIDSGSRNNSLTIGSPLSHFRSPLSPANSRTSSLQSISESPLAFHNTPTKPAQSNEAELLTTRMNRSRSNSVQNEEPLISALSPSNSINRSANRVRSNSASKKPSLQITKIDEDKSIPSPDVDIGEHGNSPKSNASGVESLQSEADDTLTSIIVSHDEIDSSKKIVKKVRFKGVPKYDASEDAPSPNKALKNFRRVVFRTSSGVEVTKSKEKILTSQEGAAFRAFNHQGNTTWEGFSSLSQKQNQTPTMRSLTQPAAGKRLSKIFKTR